MRIEDLVTPGIIPSGKSLRGEAVKAINYLAVVSDYTGSTGHAAQLATFFTACATEAQKYVRVAVTGVTVGPATSTGAVGSTVQLTATIAPAGATGKKVTWSSSDSTVATVDVRGLVKRLKVGTATITATSQDDSTKTGTSVITVA
jgi:alpha-amylase